MSSSQRQAASAPISAEGAIERPVSAGGNAAAFGSDVVAETLRALDIPYIALNPGASYRGLHDSLVNYLGNERPQMLLCLHEEAAIAIAHGYAKVTGRAMATAVHSNVGLMHGTMAIFNAWCDRMPVIVLGATGPVDAQHRRPWIDWIHTARDQGALVRGYTKWDDQPASPAAAREAVLRATWIANTAPMGPVYVNLDAEMQEAKLPEPLPPVETGRFIPQAVSAAPAALIEQAADTLSAAKKPVILAGRVSRSVESWNARVALAETLKARVVTDLKIGASFPTDHPLHVGAPGTLLPVPEALEVLAEADVILSLDWVDLSGTLKAAKTSATVIQVSVDHHLHNGWSMDYQGLPTVDQFLAGDPDQTVPALLEHLGGPRKSAVVSAPSRAIAKTVRWSTDRRASGFRLAPGRRRSRGIAHASAAVLERRMVAVPPSARLSRRRRRRRCRWRTRHFGWRGARTERLSAKRFGPAPGRDLRRRRLPDGCHGALDGGALPHSPPSGRGQQSLLLQR